MCIPIVKRAMRQGYEAGYEGGKWKLNKMNKTQQHCAQGAKHIEARGVRLTSLSLEATTQARIITTSITPQRCESAHTSHGIF